MLKFGDKEYRNLEEQVQKNKDDIQDFREGNQTIAEFGIRVIGKAENATYLPEFGDNYGDAYLVGTEPPYNYYVWTRDLDIKIPTMKTDNGILYTDYINGTLNAKGTATDDSSYVFFGDYYHDYNYLKLTIGKKYTVSGCPTGGSDSTYSLQIQSSDYSRTRIDIGNGYTFTADKEDWYMFVRVNPSAGEVNLTYTPKVVEVDTGKIMWEMDNGDKWLNIGAFPVPGEKGEKGDKGEQGQRGIEGLQGVRGLQGVQGVQGYRGETGPAGPVGPQGPQGSIGPQGIGFRLLGTLTSSDQLPDPNSVRRDSAYFVTQSDGVTNHMYVIQGTTILGWTDIGEVSEGPTGPQGPKGTDGTNGTNGLDGIGIDSLEQTQFPFGQFTSVTYAMESGISLQGINRYLYMVSEGNAEDKEVDDNFTLPIVAGDNLEFDVADKLVTIKNLATKLYRHKLNAVFDRDSQSYFTNDFTLVTMNSTEIGNNTLANALTNAVSVRGSFVNTAGVIMYYLQQETLKILMGREDDYPVAINKSAIRVTNDDVTEL